MQLKQFLVVVAFLCLSSSSFAYKSCQPYDATGAQYCTYEVPFSYRDVAQQSNSQWCWAAAISMVFNYYGYDVPQEQVYGTIKGTISTNEPGMPYELNAALNRTWTEIKTGRRFESDTKKFFNNWKTILKELRKNKPVILGAVGHATVGIGAETIERGGQILRILGVSVVDPWPFSQTFRYYNYNELNGVSYVARITLKEVRSSGDRDDDSNDDNSGNDQDDSDNDSDNDDDDQGNTDIDYNETFKDPKDWLTERAALDGYLSESGKMKCKKKKTNSTLNIYRVQCNDKRSSLVCVGFFKKIGFREYRVSKRSGISRGYTCKE